MVAGHVRSSLGKVAGRSGTATQRRSPHRRPRCRPRPRHQAALERRRPVDLLRPGSPSADHRPRHLRPRPGSASAKGTPRSYQAAPDQSAQLPAARTAVLRLRPPHARQMEQRTDLLPLRLPSQYATANHLSHPQSGLPPRSRHPPHPRRLASQDPSTPRTSPRLWTIWPVHSSTRKHPKQRHSATRSATAPTGSPSIAPHSTPTATQQSSARGSLKPRPAS